jgi:probable phosphoglycerate mutase
VSDLQCPTTLLLSRAGKSEPAGGSLTEHGRTQAAALGESLAGRRVAHVWTGTEPRAEQTAAIVAARLGVGVTSRPALAERGGDDPASLSRIRAALEEVADAHRGETVLVITRGDVVRLGIPALARMEARPGDLPPCAPIEVAIDADDWVCRAWPRR